MTRFLFLLSVLMLVGFVGNLEYIRYTICLALCHEQQQHDLELSENVICRDWQLRKNYMDAGTVNCDMAEARLRFTPKQCALRKWFSESELVRMWQLLTSSYWALLGLILSLLTVFLRFIFAERRERHRDKEISTARREYLKEMRDFMDTQRIRDAELPALAYSGKSKKRKKEHDSYSFA